MIDSRISGLYKLSVPERIAELETIGWLSPSAARELRAGRQVLSAAGADKMIENVLGVFGLPLAIAPNFVINGRECIVPLVTEEPSIVAALSNAAALARDSGGFSATLEESLLAGQIHVVGFDDRDVAVAALAAARADLLQAAEEVHPRLAQRGGGVREIEIRPLQLPDGKPLIAIHVLVDTCDAMGANLVNTICESIAPEVARICGGEVALRILSNLADRSICKAAVRYPVKLLATAAMAGEEVRDRIVLANDIAMVDPYRAATHNKGVMNGVDAVAIATGNDWRAIESSAHAFAAQGGSYSALTNWSVADNGDLRGEITIPLKAGIVGGTLSTNAAAALGLAISGVQSASQLAELMAAVGLAQNFSALKALATNGIQQGHMRLHARSVAAAAGATDAQLEEVVEKLVESGEIKDWKAVEILEDLHVGEDMADASVATAAGKIILLGEHAVVYGRHALAVPIRDAVRVAVTSASGPTRVNIGEWGLQSVIDPDDSDGIGAAVSLIADRLGAKGQCFRIEVSTDLPIGMGLGSSAAIAVAMTRAIALHLGRDIDDAEVNEIAYDCEKLAHGTPSGVDNTLSCYGEPMLFQNAGVLKIEQLSLKEPLPMVIGFSHQSGPTHEQVAGVRARFERDPKRYNALFDQIDELAQAGAHALTAGHYPELGRLMNICHGLLNALEVSTPDLEHMVSIARESGALGAKITGAGGGGSMIALCPNAEEAVQRALNQAGYQCLQMNTGEAFSE